MPSRHRQPQPLDSCKLIVIFKLPMDLICSKCGGAHDGTGHRSGAWCAACTKAYAKAYYETNKARLLPLQRTREKAYRAKDPDAYRAKVRAAKAKRKAARASR